MSIRTILLIIAIILLFCAAAGLQTVSVGTVTLHLGWGGLFFFAASFLPSPRA